MITGLFRGRRVPRGTLDHYLRRWNAECECPQEDRYVSNSLGWYGTCCWAVLHSVCGGIEECTFGGYTEFSWTSYKQMRWRYCSRTTLQHWVLESRIGETLGAQWFFTVYATCRARLPLPVILYNGQEDLMLTLLTLAINRHNQTASGRASLGEHYFFRFQKTHHGNEMHREEAEAAEHITENRGTTMIGWALQKVMEKVWDMNPATVMFHCSPSRLKAGL